MLKRKVIASIKNWINTKIKNVLLYREPDKREKHILSNDLQKTIMRNCLKSTLSRWLLLLTFFPVILR